MATENQEPRVDDTQKPVILAIETSSRVGSVALALGPTLIEESQLSGPMQHSRDLFPTISSLLKGHSCVPTDIGQVHIAIGPGSFTGLRIAVAMAKAMHLAHAVQIVTVDSLDVVAANLAGTSQGCMESESDQSALPGRIATLFDAKRNQFYASVYQFVATGHKVPPSQDRQGPGYCIPAPHNGLWKKIAADSLMTAPELVENFAGADRIGLVGDGLLYHRDDFDVDRTIVLPERYWSPRARNVHRLGYQKAVAGLFANPLALTPFYLRGPEVTLRRSP